MKITVTQTTKKLANNENLICIRVFNNGKYKHYSTGVSCTENNWNDKSNTVSSKDRNYKEKNLAIQTKLTEITKLYSNTTEEVKEIKNSNITFFDIIEKKANECNTYSYKKNFIQLSNHLKEKFNAIPCNVSQEFFNAFLQSLSNKPEAQKTKLIKMFKLVYNYGIQNNYITKFTNFKYNAKEYNKAIHKDRYLNFSELSCIINAYKKLISSGDIKNINNDNKIYSLCVYILHICFQGIAPVDMAQIKLKDIEENIINSNEYDYEKALNNEKYKEEYNRNNKQCQVIELSFKRQKTNIQVDVCTSYSILQPILDIITNGKSKDDYLINCLNKDKQYTEKQKQSRITNYYVKLAKCLNEYMSEYCNTYDIPTLQQITYYSARHTVINALAQLNVAYNVIRRYIGHKDTTLDKNYIQQKNKDYVKYIDKLFNNVISVYDLMNENR